MPLKNDKKCKGKDIVTEEDDEDDQEGAGFCEQMAMAAGSIGAFIYKNSYIFTNVVMMVGRLKVSICALNR